MQTGLSNAISRLTTQLSEILAKVYAVAVRGLPPSRIRIRGS